jgi:hypothetical protein
MEAEIGRIGVQGQPRQKDPILTSETSRVVLICNSSYTGGIGRRIAVQVQTRAKT